MSIVGGAVVSAAETVSGDGRLSNAAFVEAVVATAVAAAVVPDIVPNGVADAALPDTGVAVVPAAEFAAVDAADAAAKAMAAGDDAISGSL